MSCRLLVLVSFVAASLQVAAQPLAPATDTYRVAGTQIPRSQLVESFLRRSHAILNDLDDEFRLDLLSKLGLEPDSDAESTLREAAQKMFILEFGEDGPIVVEDPEKSSVIHYRHLGPDPEGVDEADRHVKAIEAGKIFGQLLKELRAMKVDERRIDAYLREQIAPGMSIVSDEPFEADHPLRLRSEAFEAEVRKALQ